jgi:2-polyprenyl-3-methyl-5-hydroxy-6-metoxy-1,4-benzoquinol methylase
VAGYVPFNDLPWSAHRLMVDLAGRDGRVLELGCSSGYVSERLVAAGNAVVGVDADADDARAAETVCERVVVGDLEAMDLPGEPGSYDAVVCGDVLEHLHNHEEVLGRIRTVLKPGGRLVVSVPNVANAMVRGQLLLGRFRYTERGLLDRTHVHFFTLATLREDLEAAGFDVERVEVSVVSAIRPTALRRVAHRLALAFRGLLAHQFVVLARPR